MWLWEATSAWAPLRAKRRQHRGPGRVTAARSAGFCARCCVAAQSAAFATSRPEDIEKFEKQICRRTYLAGEILCCIFLILCCILIIIMILLYQIHGVCGIAHAIATARLETLQYMLIGWRLRGRKWGDREIALWGVDSVPFPTTSPSPPNPPAPGQPWYMSPFPPPTMDRDHS